MPLYRVALTLTRTEGDNVQWGFGIDAASEPTSSDLSDFMVGVDLAYTAEGAGMTLATMQISLAEAFPAEGGPAVAVFSSGGDLAIGSGGEGNADVALAVSEHVETPRGLSPRGRIYFGPFNGTAIGTMRPSAAIQNGARDFLAAIYDVEVGLGWTPVVISKRDGGAERPAPVGLPVVAISTDNAWDTQRRRGHAPTERTTVVWPTPPEGP